MAVPQAALDYFARRVNSTPWDNATEAQKEKALATAANDIADLPAHPKNNEQRAIYEQALFLLATSEASANAAAQGISFDSVTGVGSRSYKNLAGRPIAPGAHSALFGNRPGVVTLT